VFNSLFVFDMAALWKHFGSDVNTSELIYSQIANKTQYK